jgi:L-lactate dehydrogenase complex protein LldG
LVARNYIARVCSQHFFYQSPRPALQPTASLPYAGRIRMLQCLSPIIRAGKFRCDKLANKQEMLGRIRKCLGLAPGQTSSPEDLSRWPDLGAVCSPIPPSELVAHFEAELTSVGASAHRVKSRSDVAALLATILTDRAAGAVLTRNPMLRSLGVEDILREIGVPAWKWPADQGSEVGPEAFLERRERCFTAAGGITGADFALAESGTLVLTSFTEGSQLSSLAPPVHIAFYLREHVVATLEEVLAGLPDPASGAGASPGRSVVLITGTSRTADIEQILVRGVHGPRELHAVLVEDCLALQ